MRSATGRRARTRLAAVLAGGTGAVLSHRSAAALWQLVAVDGPHPDVTTVVRRTRHPGIAGHAASLSSRETTVRMAIPVTTPARTLVDLAHELDERELVRAVREAQFRRLFDRGAVRASLVRRPSRALRELLDDTAVTQTGLEDRLLAICDRHRIPRPRTQQRLVAGRVDFVWPAERLVVETDGWEAHSTAVAFQADRTASNALQLAGYAVLRFTYADLKRRSRLVARQIRAALRGADHERPSPPSVANP
jgi:very-short-patch-repair endonuclease